MEPAPVRLPPQTTGGSFTITSRLSGWGLAALFGLCFLGLAVVSRSLSVATTTYIPFWLPSGLYVAVLAVNVPRLWFRYCAAALLANAVFDLPSGTPVAALLGFYTANTIIAVSGAWLLRKFVAERLTLKSLREFLRLVVIAGGVAPALGAIVGAGTLVASGMSQSVLASWGTWFLNSTLANLLLVPLILVWSDRTAKAALFGTAFRVVEFALLAVSMGVAAWVLLVVNDGIFSPNKALLLPFLLWAAIRFGLRGVTFVNLLLALLVAFFTTHYLTGVTPEQVQSGAYVGVLQGFLAVSVIVGLVPTVVIAERDHHFARLSDSQQRSQLATETTGVGIWEWDPATNVMKWDAQMFRLYGVAPTADGCIPYDVWQASVMPEQLQAQEGALRETIQKRGGSRHEFQIRRRDDGRVRVIQAIGGVRLDPHGNVVSLVGTNLDITERKQDEEALRANEERFRRLVENGNEVVSLYDEGGTILYESPGVERVKGFTSAELVGTSAMDLIHPDDIPRAVESLATVLSAPAATTRLEVRCRHQDGRYRWLDLVATNMLHDPAIRAIVGNYRDITAWRAANERLRASEELLRKLSEQVPGMIYQYRQWPDGRGSFPYASEGIRHIFEVTPDAVRESAAVVFARIHPDDLDKLTVSITRSAESLEHWRCEFRVLLPTRGERWLLAHSVPERLPDGSTLWHGNVSDVTESKRVEAKYLQAQKMEIVGQLAGGVAHDFNNILTVINGYSEVLLGTFGPNDPRAGQTAAIAEAGGRAAALTAQLLAFSRKTIVAPEVFDLRAAVARSERMLRRLIGEDIALTVVTCPTACWVRADLHQIEQVLLNLVVNARDAMPTGGELILATRPVVLTPVEAADGRTPGRYSQLTVTDCGYGMTDEVKAKVFEPFFTTKEVGKGSGLGLATVYGIVQQACGHIDFETAVDRGTTFRVLLPEASPSQSPSNDTTSAVPPVRGTETVLLSEDDDGVRAVSTSALEAHGYKVIATSSAREALAVLLAHPEAFNLLVTDVVMPEMSGRELADAARVRCPTLRVLFVSGYTDDAVVRHGVQAGDAFLQKPFTPHSLARKVRETLDAAPNPSTAKESAGARKGEAGRPHP